MFKKIASRIAAASAVLAVTAGQAMAELPTEVSGAVTTYKTDATSAIGMVMGAGVVIWGLKKLGQKMGWL
ncbi:major capsid protein [Comamonas terrae]|uniref:Major capsid protein n=1 Tax=Comamonas terrae TaxID=673548 RepID=A0ABW5UP52_9BURK|nr:major capsid protein [Comamonas terrae]